VTKYKLLYPESYIKQARKFPKRHPDLIRQYRKTLELLEINPHHPSLRLHALKGGLQGLHSVSINIGIRIILELIIQEKEIVLVNIGVHEEVY
jgi:mRNA-degrading endonuclease YafQ of YafQ-DinJ toxin-antitoxin module